MSEFIEKVNNKLNELFAREELSYSENLTYFDILGAAKESENWSNFYIKLLNIRNKLESLLTKAQNTPVGKVVKSPLSKAYLYKVKIADYQERLRFLNQFISEVEKEMNS